MKKANFILAIVVITIFATVSCGGNDDDDIDYSPSLNNLFVGCWDISGSSTLFMADGSIPNKGRWSYNKDSGILGITANGWQWQIGAVDTLAWTGLPLWQKNPKSQTIKRSNANSALTVLFECRKWINPKGKTIEIYREGTWLCIKGGGHANAIYGGLSNNNNCIECIKDNKFVIYGRMPNNGESAIGYLFDPYNMHNSRFEIHLKSGEVIVYKAE